MGSIQKVQQAGGGGGVDDILFWKKKLEFLRGRPQISFVLINNQLAARTGEFIEVVVSKSMGKI